MIRPTGRQVAKSRGGFRHSLCSKLMCGLWCVTGPVIAISVSACSSSKATKRGEFGPTYVERMSATEKAMKNSNSAMRSSFEKEIPKSTTDRAFNASAFHAKDMAGMKRFSGADSADHAKNFSGADKKDFARVKSTREAEAQNKLAARMFRTPDNRFDTKANHDDKKPFTHGSETFVTHENRAGTKEMEKNKKPVILEPEKPDYTEDDVKRLLNKS